MLPEINLLPWRDEQKKQHKRRFYQLAGLCIVLFLIVQHVTTKVLDQQKNRQTQRIIALSDYSEKLESRLSLMYSVYEQNRVTQNTLFTAGTINDRSNQIIRLMNWLPSSVPKGVYLDSMKITGMEIEVSGHSENIASLTDMLKRFEQTEQFKDVEMHSIEQGDLPDFHQSHHFRVSFRLNIESNKKEEPEESDEN